MLVICDKRIEFFLFSNVVILLRTVSWKKNTMDVAARREARRRRILENSENRLKLITGASSELLTEPEEIVNNKSQTKNENKQSLENHEHEALNFMLESVKNLHENETIGLESLISESLLEQVSALTESNANVQKQPLSASNNVKSSYLSPYYKSTFIIALAIIIRFLFIFQMQFCLRDSVILPFIIAEITFQLLNKDINSINNSLFNTILLLSSLPPIHVNRLMWILKFIEDFTQDFSLYFVTFLITHILLEFLII